MTHTKRWMTGVWAIALASATMLAAPATSVPGIPAIQAPVPAPEAPKAPSPSVAGVTARSLARIALVDLKFARTPGPPEFAVAAELLALAHEIDPRDEDILRLLIEATTQAGDQSRVAEFSRALLRLDPADTVAQLNVVSANISALQDADQRLAAYARLLGPRGESLDPAVRSRLALDCALLHREAGNLAGFTEHLAMAARLDATNKEAAALVAALVASRGDPAPRRVEAAILLLLADPLDAASHFELARELASGGAHVGANRFFRLGRSILEAYGQVIPTDIVSESAVMTWLARGPAAVVNDLNEAILTPRRAAIEAVEKAKAAGATPEEIAKMGNPKSIRLQPELERLWLLAASAAADDTGIRVALNEIADTATVAKTLAEDASARPPGFSAEAARSLAVEQRLALVWARLLVNQQVAEAESDFAALLEGGTFPVDVLDRFAGWFFVRKGEIAQARAKLEPLAGRDPMARLGLAAALETEGSRLAAGEAYARVAADLLPTMTGAWARSRAAIMLQRTPDPIPGSPTLESMARGVPDWIDQTIDANPSRRRGEPPQPQPRLIEMLGVRLVSDTGGPLDKTLIEVSLRNMSAIPLALGSERTLNARFMLAPIIDIGGRKAREPASDIVSLERRLRLMPREQLTVRVWADAGFSGYLSELAAGDLTRLRWRVLQGFRYDAKSVMQVGPYALSGETALYTRRTFPRSGDSITDLAAALRDCPEADLPPLIGAIRWRLFRDENEEIRLQPTERQAVAATLAERYVGASPEVRLLMLAMIPPRSAVRALGSFDDAVMGVAESDPRVALVRLATRVAEKNSPALDAAEQSGEPRLVRTARAMRARLDLNPRTYSRFSFLGQ